MPTEAAVGTSDDTIECNICMEPVRRRNRITLPCFHVFHKKCILKWLRNNRSCPICRSTCGMDSLVDEARFWDRVGARILQFIFGIFSCIFYLCFSVLGYNPSRDDSGSNRGRELVHVIRSTSMNSLFGMAIIWTRATTWLTETISSLSFPVFAFVFDSIFVNNQSRDDHESNETNRHRELGHRSTWATSVNSLFGMARILTRATTWLADTISSLSFRVFASFFDNIFVHNQSRDDL